MILRRFCFVAACVLSFYSFRAEAYLQALSPESFRALYALAQRGDVSAINAARSRGLNIDSVNSSGDTGLCVAARNRDRRAYKSFLQSGANPSHPCTWEINGYREFMQSVVINPVRNMDTAVAANAAKMSSMSWKTKALIGAGVVAAGAGTAIALGGGGGGGGGGSSTDPNCVHGHWSESVCVCDTGYAGEKCNTCAAGYGNYGTDLCYKTLECAHGTQQAGKCVCENGYGGTLCDECINGYGKDSTGMCVKKQSKDVYGNPDINSNYNEAGTLTLTNNNYADVYGLFYDAAQTPHDYRLDQDKFANGYFSIEPTTATVTEPDYKYDDDGNKIWYDTDGTTMKGYVKDSNAYYFNGETAGHVINDVVYDNNSTEIGDVLKTDTKKVEENFLVMNKTSSISINNNSDGTVYGLYSNNADTIYNVYAELKGSGILVSDIASQGSAKAIGTISINNVGDGRVYGIFGGNDIYTAEFDDSSAEETSPTAIVYSEINVSNKGNGAAYGIYQSGTNGTIYNQNKIGTYSYIDSVVSVINSQGSGNTYGLYSLGTIQNSGEVASSADAGNAYGLYTKGGTINNIKDISETTLVYSVQAQSATGNVYGAYVEDGTMTNGRVISAKTTGGTGNAFGIYVTQSDSGTATLTNTSGLEVESAGGDAYGIYNKGGTIENSTQRYEINVTSTTGNAYGIYSDGGKVTNSGRIWVSGPSKEKTYGIYATNGAKITNTGEFQFRINNIDLNWEDNPTYTSTGCLTPDGGYAIYLTGGAEFENMGLVSATKALSLGKGVTLAQNGTFSAPAITGNLSISSDVVKNGFEQNYTLLNAIDTSDASALNLSSQSVLFDAELKGNDVVLTKKDFNEVVENSTVASFLEKNYDMQNNEALFANLKTKSSLNEVENAMRDLTGQNVISRFADEDMIMQKELNFDLNSKLFALKDGEFSFSGEVAPKVFQDRGSNTKYALSGTNMAGGHFGVGLAISELRSDDGHLKNSRESKNFQLLMPYQLKKNGFNMVFSPKMSYLYGTYDRNGYESRSYDGHIEKRAFGLESEVRYPLSFGGFELSPATAVHLTAYQTKLKEDTKQYSLSSANQRTYSAELGFGAYISKEKKIAKNHQLKLMAGAMLYHEFGNPYDMELQMNGMNGTFKISDEKRRDDYAVLRSTLSYDAGDVSIYGGFLSYVDSEYRSRFDFGLKYRF
ncbi:MAG: hypothetical protein IJ870_04795 [Alphaproteobacteria bacterium]|nr:hypothetical protein [Alphaproteobacteria bacterium]